MDSKVAAFFVAGQDDDPLASETLSTVQDEAQIAQEFMLARRLRIITLTARGFVVLLSFFLLLYLVLVVWRLPDEQRGVGWFTFLVLVGCDILFFFVAFQAARKRLQSATLNLLLSVDITSISFLYFWSSLLGHKDDPFAYVQFISLSLTILIAGAFGTARLALATTLLVNVVTVSFGLAYITDEWGLFVITGVLEEWAVFTISAVMASSYQRTLRDLSLAYARARQLDELKERFITNVNHELRTPVMTMLGYIDYLQQTWHALPPEHLTRGFQKAREVGEQLMRLIQSILDVRRIDESIVENPEPVALRPVCQQALQLVDPREARLEDRPVTIAIPEGLTVWGETTRVQQILTNLISNAGKYSPPGSPIEITASVLPGAPAKERPRRKQSATPLGAGVVEIRVRDYGLGIPPDQLPLLFNRFVRLPRDLASTVTGNGLGLYLCRTLATAMRGRIWAESSGITGEGSTFVLQLPFCMVAPVPAHSAPISS